MSLLMPDSAEQPAAVVERVEHLGQVEVELLGDVPEQARVDVAAAGAHHQALERGEAHRGVDRCGRRRTAVALQPLPRCSVTIRSDSGGRPSSSAARPLT